MSYQQDYDEYDKKENLNLTSTSTSSTLRRASSILKIAELDNKLIDEPEENTRVRKSRRVSFSARVQIKTFDQSLNDHVNQKCNDSVSRATIENTLANSNARVLYTSQKNEKKLIDISNSSLIMQSIKPVSNNDETDMSRNKTILEPEPMEIESEDSINNFNQSEMYLSATMCSFSMNQSSIELTNNVEALQTQLTKEKGETKISQKTNSEVLKENNNNNNNELVSAIYNSTNQINVITHNNEIEDLSTKDIEHSIYSQKINNNTITIEKDKSQETNLTTDNFIEFDPNNLTRTIVRNDEPSLIEKSQHIEEFHGILPAANETINYGLVNNNNQLSNSINNLSIKSQNLSCMPSANTNYLSSTHNNQNATIDFGSISTLDITKAQMVNYETELVSKINFESLKEKLNNLLDSNSESKEIFKEALGKIKSNSENLHKNFLKLNKLTNELVKKRDELRERLNNSKIKNNRNKYLFGSLSFNENRLNKIKSDLKDLQNKNKTIEMDHAETLASFENLKEKTQNNYEKLKKLKHDRDEKEKFKKLYEKIFNEKNIPFEIINFDHDTILLSFFYDLIYLEIKATNIVNDINSKGVLHQQSSNFDFNNQNFQQKCMNYPIQHIFLRSTIDSYGNIRWSKSFGAFNKNIEETNSKSKRISSYLRFCVDLILSEIGEGDLMSSNKKYKYVKDLPMLISHINLACKCASNLALDLDFLSKRTQNSKIKFEFDSKNHIICVTLPDFEDICYYKIKMNVIPGSYYQQPILAQIEKSDFNEFFEPNSKKLLKVLDGHFFEEGSIKGYLDKIFRSN